MGKLLVSISLFLLGICLKHMESKRKYDLVCDVLESVEGHNEVAFKVCRGSVRLFLFCGNRGKDIKSVVDKEIDMCRKNLDELDNMVRLEYR
jgi:hypothetical protein